MATVTEAYASRPVVTERAANGTAVSSAYSPNLVAEMLELLAVEPESRVLEIGAATGINAALLAELGQTGHVTTIEIDDDLADGARRSLDRAGYPRVDVICCDDDLGQPGGEPYDRIVVTAGAWDIPAAWWQQVAPGGRIVVPVRLHGSGLTGSCRSSSSNRIAWSAPRRWWAVRADPRFGTNDLRTTSVSPRRSCSRSTTPTNPTSAGGCGLRTVVGQRGTNVYGTGGPPPSPGSY